MLAAAIGGVLADLDEKLTLLMLSAAISGILADSGENLTLLLLAAVIGGILADSGENLALLMLRAVAVTLSYSTIQRSPPRQAATHRPRAALSPSSRSKASRTRRAYWELR